ncbi:MAG: indolepyruvate oxidoreductase subunit beta [Patescibacteria group bacterium]|nr:indolepyruvate oxidoreductase subunit beta [Patescibacteria group bacterium]
MENLNDKKFFNVIISGYGGQGVLTLAEILANAAQLADYDVKQAELHGLAQRGGSLECHLRFGKKIISPLIRQADADIIIGLELVETLRACYYANKNKTIILTNNKYFNPDPCAKDNGESEKIKKEIEKFSCVLHSIPADKILKENNLSLSLINTFMLGFLVKENALPIKKELIWRAISEKIKPEFLDKNEKVFNLAQQ